MFKIKIPNLDKAQLNKLLLMVFCLLFLLFGSIFLIFRPQMRKIDDCRLRSEAIEKKIVDAKAKIAKKDKLLSEIEEIKESLVQYEKKLPREKDIPVFLEELTEIIESGEIEFISLRPQRMSPIEELAGKDGEGAYLRLPIEISMRCGYHDLEKFLFRLEQTKRFIKVVKVSIKGSTKSGKSFQSGHDINLTVEVYIYQEAAPLT